MKATNQLSTTKDLLIARIKDYYRLTKPGIIYGNGLSVIAGFLLASAIKKTFDAGLFIATLAGVSLVIACGCVINNYIDRRVDAVMTRTKKRPLVTASIPVRVAIAYGMVLGIIGFIVLFFFTNSLTTLIGAVGLFFYLVMYSIFKRKSPFGTVVGSVSGSTPIVAGYTAVTGRFDGAALILFLVMTFWQMPHFYAIAMYRHKDYKAAGLPVLPVVKGMRITKLYTLSYVLAFTLAAICLTVFGYTHYLYLTAVTLLGAYWFYKGLKNFNFEDDRWGRQMFGISLIVLLTFSFAVSVGRLVP